ncbi:MAG: hypothetical protein O2931_08880 [Planctomycetota bacterium]|nr:hypothetical protein [Planctomycetota bacterium]MDA1178896.1 hypothetical protein [Planctomycetota bacterium]
MDQISTLERADKIVPFDPHARHKVAYTLLTLWQKSGSYFDPDEFVGKVAQTAFALHNDGASVFAASDVPAH